MAEFKLINTPILIDLIEGNYDIRITGGRSVQLPKDFDITIINTANNKKVSIQEYTLKIRYFNAVNFFKLNIPTNGKYKISIKNYKNIIVKKTNLFFARRFFSNVNIENISIELCKKR